MNKYTTIEKVKFELGTNNEPLLSDVTDSKLAEIIETQSRVIDEYLQSVKNVPFDDIGAPDSTLPKIIEELCLIFIKYKVWTREAFKDIPESIRTEYTNAIKLIEKIQLGKITIGTDENTTADGACDSFRWTSDPRIFTEDL